MDAPRHFVFEGISKPELLKRWLWGPSGWTMIGCENDMKVGGSFRHVWRKGDGTEMTMRGVYRKVKKIGLEFKGFAREDMKAIKGHVLIALGDRDGVRLEHAVEMFRLIPTAQLAVFPGADHFLLWTNPDTVLSLIAAFLDAPCSRPREGS